MIDKTNSPTPNAHPPAHVAGTDTMDRLAKSAHDGIDAASNAAHPQIDKAAASAHKAVDNADQFADYTAKTFEKASTRGGKMYASSAKYLREHPVLSLSVAVGTGYIISRLLASRKS